VHHSPFTDKNTDTRESSTISRQSGGVSHLATFALPPALSRAYARYPRSLGWRGAADRPATVLVVLLGVGNALSTTHAHAHVHAHVHVHENVHMLMHMHMHMTHAHEHAHAHAHVTCVFHVTCATCTCTCACACACACQHCTCASVHVHVHAHVHVHQCMCMCMCMCMHVHVHVDHGAHVSSYRTSWSWWGNLLSCLLCSTALSLIEYCSRTHFFNTLYERINSTSDPLPRIHTHTHYSFTSDPVKPYVKTTGRLPGRGRLRTGAPPPVKKPSRYSAPRPPCRGFIIHNPLALRLGFNFYI
jgi:hypothetical protein